MHTPWSALPPPDGEQCGCMHASAACFELDSSCFSTFTTRFTSDSPSVPSPLKEDGDANRDAPSWSSMPPPAKLAVLGQLSPGPVNGMTERQEKRAAGGTTMTPSSSSNNHQMAGWNRRSRPRRCSRYSNSRRMVWWRTGSTIRFDCSAGRLVLVTPLPPFWWGTPLGWI